MKLNTMEAMLEETKAELFQRFNTEFKIIPPDAAPQTLRSCLERVYHQALLKTVTADEIAAREAKHQSKLRDFFKGEFAGIGQFLFKVADCGKRIGRILFEYDESTLTESGKFPIFYKYPCVDGVMRETFQEYTRYIFAREFMPTNTHITMLEIGDYIRELLEAKFPILNVEYITTNQKNPFPEIRLIIHLTAQDILL